MSKQFDLHRTAVDRFSSCKCLVFKVIFINRTPETDADSYYFHLFGWTYTKTASNLLYCLFQLPRQIPVFPAFLLLLYCAIPFHCTAFWNCWPHRDLDHYVLSSCIQSYLDISIVFITTIFRICKVFCWNVFGLICIMLNIFNNVSIWFGI